MNPLPVQIEYQFFKEDRELMPPNAPTPVVPDIASAPLYRDIIFLGPGSSWMVEFRRWIQEPERLRLQLWLVPLPEADALDLKRRLRLV